MAFPDTRALLVVMLAATGAAGCSRLEALWTHRRSRAAASERSEAARPAPAASEQPVSADPARVPPGYVEMVVGGVAPTSHGNAVVLTDATAKVGVPIFVGGTEALSIALRLQKRHYERPLTHDLLDHIIHELDGQVVAVRVDKLQDNVFHGSVLVRHAGHVSLVDSRPSDAIALAIGNAAPIHVNRSVVERAGISLEQLDLKDPGALPTESAEEPEGVEL